MNDDTVKLVRIPAETWRAVVEALEEAAESMDSYSDSLNSIGLAMAAKTAFSALELARNVSAE